MDILKLLIILSGKSLFFFSFRTGISLLHGPYFCLNIQLHSLEQTSATNIINETCTMGYSVPLTTWANDFTVQSW